MTLREALKTVNRKQVFRLIWEKDRHNIAECDGSKLEQTKVSYTHVIEELLSKPKVKLYKYPWFVQRCKDPVDGKMYFDVSFHNPNYEAPSKDLKPWDGKPPKGHYNCNLTKYSEFLGAGWTPWKNIVDAEIMSKGNFTLERLVAEILWEITFYGWTEKKVKICASDIKGRIDDALEEIKAGKCVTLPPKKKDDYKIVIPDIVIKQLKKIVDKSKKAEACNNCYGYGLWPDGTAPMGPMDASDGMPTIPCPKCRANQNPISFCGA